MCYPMYIIDYPVLDRWNVTPTQMVNGKYFHMASFISTHCKQETHALHFEATW